MRAGPTIHLQEALDTRAATTIHAAVGVHRARGMQRVKSREAGKQNVNLSGRILAHQRANQPEAARDTLLTIDKHWPKAERTNLPICNGRRWPTLGQKINGSGSPKRRREIVSASIDGSSCGTREKK
jgi:hypothetical protein